MGYHAGKDMLLKVDFGQGAGFQTIGGIKTRRITLPDTSREVTNQDSEGNWREMIQGVGIDSMDFSGDGILKSGPVMTQLLAARRDRIVLNWQVIIPGLGTFEGPFTIGQIELSGDQGEVVNFSLSCMSAGPVGFQPNTAVAAL